MKLDIPLLVTIDIEPDESEDFVEKVRGIVDLFAEQRDANSSVRLKPRVVA